MNTSDNEPKSKNNISYFKQKLQSRNIKLNTSISTHSLQSSQAYHLPLLAQLGKIMQSKALPATSISQSLIKMNTPFNPIVNLQPYTSYRLPCLGDAKISVNACGIVKAYAANTHKGIIRDYNEDRVSIIYNIQKPHTFPADKKWPIVSYYSLFDGHGGSECANYLRENLQQFIINDLEFPDNPQKAIYNGYMRCEAQYLSSCTNEFSGSCATMVLIVGKVIKKRAIYISDTQEIVEFY